MKHDTPKATRHVNQNEGLIFEKSSPGKAAWKLPPLDVPEVDSKQLLGSAESGYGDNSKFLRDTDRAMLQLNDAAQSIRMLADILARHPEALVRGRADTGRE